MRSELKEVHNTASFMGQLTNQKPRIFTNHDIYIYIYTYICVCVGGGGCVFAQSTACRGRFVRSVCKRHGCHQYQDINPAFTMIHASYPTTKENYAIIIVINICVFARAIFNFLKLYLKLRPTAQLCQMLNQLLKKDSL